MANPPEPGKGSENNQPANVSGQIPVQRTTCQIPEILLRKNSPVMRNIPDPGEIIGCHLLSNKTLQMDFKKENGLVGGIYNSYLLTFDPDRSLFVFEFDGGTAYRGRGTVQLFQGEKWIVTTILSCGTSGCQLEVLENGKVILSRNI